MIKARERMGGNSEDRQRGKRKAETGRVDGGGARARTALSFSDVTLSLSSCSLDPVVEECLRLNQGKVYFTRQRRLIQML